MCFSTQWFRFPPSPALARLRNKFVEAKEALQETLAPEEILKRKKITLLGMLDEFLSITNRSGKELQRETIRLEKAFVDAGFFHRLDEDLEVCLERAYEKAKDENLKKMILKMLLILNNGYSGFLFVRLDPKHKDYKFAKGFFESLTNNQIKEYIQRISFPTEYSLNALLDLKDRDFVIKTISSLGTGLNDSGARELLLLTIQKLAPTFNFSTVCNLFEVSVNHNGDRVREDTAEVLRTKYLAQSLNYFKCLAEDTTLNLDPESFRLRASGIKHFALMKKEESIPLLRNMLLAEQNIDLEDAVMPILLDGEICGRKGQEAAVDIIGEKLDRGESPLELYWLVLDGYIYDRASRKDREISCYYDVFKMTLSRISDMENCLLELEEIKIDLSKTFRFYPHYKTDSSKDCLINRLGLERLTEWGLQDKDLNLRNNALCVLTHVSKKQLTDFVRSGSTRAKELALALGLS
ncbi:MAG: hypothetical protein HY094_00700 [Candidatus Melainabacteria bacterium]|nr:hypothetical protein [Candidatus Melainabacteria bacterium]